MERLRSDLTWSRQETAEGTFHVVKDPATGRFFRFREAERLILRQLRTAVDPETVGTRVQAEFGAAVPPATVTRFIEQARRLGLLEDDRRAAGRPAARDVRIRGNPLYLRARVFDPNRLFGLLAPRLGFFYTPVFLAASGLLILVAIGVSLAHRGEFLQDVLRQLSPRTFVFAWLTMLAVTLLHESAHGITCRRFGGEVREIGVMLIYLTPAFYCNVSDAWLFPERSKRLWVTFSGACLELVLWAVAVLTWRVTEPDAPVHLAALVVMATSGIKNLFNLNPLIKLDGYYLLSDVLGVPNLRSKAFAHLKVRIGALWGRSEPSPAAISRREKRIYLVYGLLAALFSWGMLGLVLAHIESRLVERYQGAGFLLFTGVLAMIVSNPLKRLMARLRARRAPSEGAVIGRRRPVLAAVCAASALGAVLLGRLELKVSGEFKVLPSLNADVCALTDGVIEEIPVQEGDRVDTGDLIARLSDRDARAELAKVEAGIQEKRAVLVMLKDKTIGARATLGKSQERLRYGRTSHRRVKALRDEGLASLREVDEAAEQVAVRGKELEESRSGLNVATDEIRASEAAIARLEAEREYLSGQIRLASLVAPHPGVVTTPRLREKLGQFVKKGDLVAEVHELRTVTAEIEISEKEIADVRPGQRVLLKARALPGRTFSGTVDAIAPAVQPAGEQAWLKVVRVTTTLDNEGRLLRTEMTGTAKILCGRRSILDLLTRRIARYVRVEFWSWW